MNSLVRKKFISYSIFIIFALPITVKCDNCTVQAICECIAKNDTTQFNAESGGSSLEGHLAAGSTFDICNPRPKNNTTPAPLTTTTPKSSTSRNLVTSPASLVDQQTTHLVLYCDVVDTNNKSTIPKPKKNGTFILSLNYPCIVPPHEDHGYSTGSILVIIFFTCVFAYLGLGIAVRFFLIGARGVEVLPHLDFWKDFPALIRDGAKFLQNGCTARPSDVATASPEGYDAI